MKAKIIACILVASVFLTSCATFKSVPMPGLDPEKYPYQFSSEDLQVKIAPFTAEEVQKYFASNLPKKNVWPVRMNIKNDGQRSYLFAKGLVGPNRISSHEAARKGRRKAGWRLGWGLFFYATFYGIPIAIPLFATGLQALGANTYMEKEYHKWEMADGELKPAEEISGILFFHSPDWPRRFEVALLEEKTNEKLVIPIDMAEIPRKVPIGVAAVSPAAAGLLETALASKEAAVSMAREPAPVTGPVLKGTVAMPPVDGTQAETKK